MTSQRKKTAPPTPRRPRSSSSSRKGLIATEKTKKQSSKKRPALDNRFHRTVLSLSCKPPSRGNGRAARRLPHLTSRVCKRRDAARSPQPQGLQPICTNLSEGVS